ncbi:hypothetical protein [Brucella gallinifaecis]|uniref:hypothetical protein n=1 Tax=Brucella gallinifaecis TaxID=215590 RepID=UPI0023608D6B|nr:hypothetical protein [Brucella gallinifaecis]
MTKNQTTFNDIGNNVSEVKALADMLVYLDMGSRELCERAYPYLIRILADKIEALDKAYDELEAELIELRKAAARR